MSRNQAKRGVQPVEPVEGSWEAIARCEQQVAKGDVCQRLENAAKQVDTWLARKRSSTSTGCDDEEVGVSSSRRAV